MGSAGFILGSLLFLAGSLSAPAYGGQWAHACGHGSAPVLDAQRSVRADSLEHAGLAEALGGIFSREKVETILSKLPPNCNIFGYDIGDFSDDDGMDVVLSVMREDAPRRELAVLFFLNDGAGFRLLRELKRRYVLEPIEVGFSIERGVCHVTEKTGEFAWRITGYAAADGSFRRVSEWTTDRMRVGARVTGVGYERTFSYETLLAEEHYYGVNSGNTFIRQKYYDLPVYPAEMSLPDELPQSIGDSSAMMIVHGGSSWYGPDDCSLFLRARHDSNAVRLNVRVHDDRLLYHADADSADHLDLDFDLSGRNRVRPDGRLQTYADDTQFRIRIIMGDGAARTPVVVLHGEAVAKTHGAEITVTHRQIKDEYQTFEFAIRIPRALFGRQGEGRSAGFVASYHDVDNPANLRWMSLAATAREFRTGQPHTYGRLHFVTDPAGESEWENLRLTRLAERLRAAGLID